MPKLLVPRLPAIGSVELILAEKTAWGLLEVLSDRGGSTRLRELFSEDPSFTLWTICIANREGGQALSTSKEAADWMFAGGIVDCLLAKLNQDALFRPTPKRQIRTWSRLFCESVRVARTTQDLDPASRGGPNAEETQLVALLHNADQWLASCRQPSSVDSAEAVLPSCWRDRIDSFRKAMAVCLPSDEPKRPKKQLKRFVKQSREKGPPVPWVEKRGHAIRAWLRAARTLQGHHELKSDFLRELELQKLLAMKELAYGAGHEINNPLANISSRAQTLLRDETDQERRHKLATINTQAFRAHEMIADMMIYAKPPKIDRAVVSMLDIVHQVLDELRPIALAQHSQLEITKRATTARFEANVDPTQFAVAIKAIGMNALEALGSYGTVTFDLEYDLQTADQLLIRITDTGPGVSAKLREHIFDPFFSGREAGRGLGFGLCKAWRIVKEHGGEVDVRSCDGETTFCIHLKIGAPADRHKEPSSESLAQD